MDKCAVCHQENGLGLITAK
ncbi:hypothetical protein ACVNW2_001684 [Campylobacter jejuni]